MSEAKISSDYRKIRRISLLVFTLFILLSYLLQSVARCIYHSLGMQANTTVSTPPVTLQKGNVSSSGTTYTNSTSANVKVTATQGTAIKRVQSNAKGGTTSVSGTLASTPLADNVLVAVIETYCIITAPSVISINQTGVSWSKQISKSGYSGTIEIEIWFSEASSEAIT